MPDYSLLGDEHVHAYEQTNGERGYVWNGAHILILRARGRKTGELRKTPLIFGRAGADYLVIASKGGAPEHPGWYRNICAHPDVEIQVRADVLAVRARTASAQEKAQLWPLMVAQWPRYDMYQQATTRDIPLVILSPLDA